MAAFIPSVHSPSIGATNSNGMRCSSFQFYPNSIFVARRVRPASTGQQFGTRSTICMTKTEIPQHNNQPTKQQLAKLYGGSYLGTSIGLSIVSYIVLYFMIEAGVDVRALVNAFGDWLATTPLGKPEALDNVSDTASTAALAYIAHKVTSPLRFPLTIAATPIVAKVFSQNPSDDVNN